MKWRNEYIVGVMWRQRSYTLAMTLLFNEDADAQIILSKIVSLASEHIKQVAKVDVVEPKDLYIYMCSMVKQKLITDES